MGKNSGKRVSRRYVETYNGFDIVKVKIDHFYKSQYSSCYDTSLVVKTERYYEFCKEGQYNRPSQAYNVTAKTIDECKEAIDNFIKDDTLYFTESERETYVHKPNRECRYIYGYNSLMKLLKQHQKADRRMQTLIKDRLVDANFHTEADYLSHKDYDGFTKFVTSHFKFKEKFEILTLTEAKRLVNPKELSEGIAKAVEEYLKSIGIKNTSVEAKFIENW